MNKASAFLLIFVGCYVDARPMVESKSPAPAANEGSTEPKPEVVVAPKPAQPLGTKAQDPGLDQTSGAPSPMVAPQAATKPPCSVKAWVSDPDPNGLNVRDAPSGTVIGKIPFGDRGPEGLGGAPELTVVAASGAWLRVASEGGRMLGWVHSSMIELQIAYEGADGGNQALRSGPSDTAKVVSSVPPESGARIKDCVPGWVHVEVAEGGKAGWLPSSRTCAASNTTCGF
jgi:hypothetical protein